MSKPHFGITNNNPGNIRWNERDRWQGLAENPRYVPRWDSTRTGFFRFSEMRFGIRAAAKTLLWYQRVWGLDTLLKIFSRWAPVGDHANDPTAYARQAADFIGVKPNQVIDLESDPQTFYNLLWFIFMHETGERDLARYITSSQMLAGLASAGVVMDRWGETLHGQEIKGLGDAAVDFIKEAFGFKF